jgi:hypothetical protein
MLALLAWCAATLAPRVVALPLPAAAHACRARGRAAVAPLYDLEAGRLGCLAVVCGGDVRAVALVERVGRTAVVWDVTAFDGDSGTALVRALVAQRAARVHLAPTLDARWHLAASFHAPPAG